MDLGPWARARPDVVALALVGSQARGTARPDSDVDVVLLTNEPELYLDSEQWAAELGGRVVATRVWGVVTERRVLLESGVELDVAVADRSWASVDPVDEGTLHVVRDGMKILHDPKGLLERVVRRAATAATSHRPGT